MVELTAIFNFKILPTMLYHIDRLVFALQYNVFCFMINVKLNFNYILSFL